MPGWLKALSAITILGGWLATVITMLWRDTLPDAGILGVPAVALAFLSPPITIGRSGNTERGDAEQAPETETERPT